ncbi:hypothetical protein [Labilibaculum antarcticum]|uniref:Redox-active disulfide protein 2 n=1 Tax=Labilibaculum antarcticum TaxID=1717717 RepID=A0A1Y1CN77_9BACT|nr:hypothetical protein [Labilibaculum antarcticum]BAX81889.1 hypothetical protein ALGA_3597 [Labilibaculum antarcticum]
MKLSAKEKDLKTISTEQLQLEAKTIKVASIALGIMLIMLLCLGIYLSINNSGSLSFIVAPFILSPILYVFSKKAFIINEELKSREL